MQMLKTKDVVVDGVKYSFTQLGAVNGRKLWLKLLKALAPAIADLAGMESLDEKAIGAVVTLVQGLDESTHELLCEELGKSCRFHEGENRPLVSDFFDFHFAGRYWQMELWIVEGVTFNFASFLGDTPLTSLVARAKEVGKAESA